MVVFRPNKERYGGLVEPTTLPIPFFDRVEGTLPRKIKHEEDGDRVIAHKRKHVDEFPLSA